ncbi:MAG: hypothetical protein Q4B78_01635 [Bacillota bacterium]|nr:hypothetical protein [Bacillota bacterium]
MKKSKKLTAVFALIMDLPLALIITLVSMLLAKNLNLPGFIMMALLAYVITFFVNFLPNDYVGFKFASKFAKPDTLKFGLIINGYISFIFTVILDIIMTAVGVLVIGHGSFGEYCFAVVAGFIPCYIAAYIIAFIVNPFADKLSREICKEPAPKYN